MLMVWLFDGRPADEKLHPMLCPAHPSIVLPKRKVDLFWFRHGSDMRLFYELLQSFWSMALFMLPSGRQKRQYMRKDLLWSWCDCKASVTSNVLFAWWRWTCLVSKLGIGMVRLLFNDIIYSYLLSSHTWYRVLDCSEIAIKPIFLHFPKYSSSICIMCTSAIALYNLRFSYPVPT